MLAAQHAEDVVAYITRHYLSGDVSAIALEASEREMAHCGIDTAFQMSGGEILVRVQDDLAFAPGWLDAVVGALQANPDIGMLGLVLDDEPRRRGRPPKVRLARRGRPRRPARLRRHPDRAARAPERAPGRPLRRRLPVPAQAAPARLPDRLPARPARRGRTSGAGALGRRARSRPRLSPRRARGDGPVCGRATGSAKRSSRPAPPATTRSSRSWPRRSISARRTTCRSATPTPCAAPAATGCASRRTTSSDARPDARGAGGG